MLNPLDGTYKIIGDESSNDDVEIVDCSVDKESLDEVKLYDFVGHAP